MKAKAAASILLVTLAALLVGCGVDKGEIPDSGGPPSGGPPANSEHPPGLTDAEKNSPGAK